jgi:hypothetical protein
MELELGNAHTNMIFLVDNNLIWTNQCPGWKSWLNNQ